jgi:hypothetical protein
MRIGIDYGRDRVELEIAEERMAPVQRIESAPRLDDPMAAVRGALDRPSGFPSLRQALTPDDHVAVVVDEHLLQLPEFITPVLEHVVSARVAPEAISIVCPPGSATEWMTTLPSAFQKVRVEVHDPADRQHLS